VLLQVALALLTFTTLSALIVDYGAQLANRNEAQNAVDAAALAGAQALAFDDYTDRSAAGRPYQAAVSVARRNLVAGEAASVEIDANVVCNSTWDAFHEASPKRACVQITAYRDAAHGNAIPSFVARLMGFNSFGVAARAIAEATNANATKCLKPIAIPDRWQEAAPPWNAASTFDRWDPMNPAVPLPPALLDTYVAPTPFGAGFGLTLSTDFGASVTLTEGTLTSPIATIKPWQYLAVEIPGSEFGAGAAAVRSNTKSCARGSVAIGDTIKLVPGAVHDNALLIADGIRDLVDVQDPGATWNAATRRVGGSCADRLVGRCASMSPRIIAIALYDPADVADQAQAGGATRVVVTNIAGLFVDSISGTQITGHLVRHPGLHDPAAVTLFDDSSFLRAPMLVE
jgi:hypothetical protein